MRKKLVVALVVGSVVAFATGAAASSLGGATSQKVAADAVVVTGCDTDGIGAGYTTTYNAGTLTYRVTAVNLTSVNAACNGKAFALTLANSANASLGQTTGTLVVSSGNATITVSPVTAQSVDRMALILSG